MRHHHRAAVVSSFAVFIVLAAAALAPAQTASPAPVKRVIVELALPSGQHTAEGRLGTPAAIAAQRNAIAAAADRIAARLPAGSRGVLRRFTTVPYVVVEADEATRAALASSPDVVRVMEDKINRTTLAESVPLIQGDQAWDAGFDGTGTAVAILDTGVDSNHPFLAGKVVAEACFSTTSATSQSTCPNGTPQQIGAGAAVPCSLDSCLHGTHVAGIAAGNGGPAGQPFSGVAKGAHIVAVQVFSIVTDATACGGTAPCAGAFDSDIIAGLEYVYSVAGSLNVVSANMSLGGDTFTTTCDSEAPKPAIDNLRSIGVATVVAAGNNSAGNALSTPACISSAISVGSTDKSNHVSFFSNVATFMSLFAPGESINSSVPGGGYQVLSGTSMAAPHVAGAWAIMRQGAPGASVSTILNAFQSTGLPIVDDRIFFGAGVTGTRISIFQALATVASVSSPVPTLTSLTPTRVRAGMGSVTLTLTGSGFNGLSVVSWNGTPLATTAMNTTTLQATVPVAAITGSSAQVSVTNPAPGGGTTDSITVPIDPPAVVTVNTTLVAPTTAVTMTLAGGFGGASDWLAMSQVGSPETSFIAYTYVGNGVTNRTWTVTMPSTPGQYEFRYFPNNGYVRAGTSPTVTVDASLKPVPVLSSLSPLNAPLGGAAFTLTLTGTGFVPTSVVQWNGSARTTTFVSSTQLQAAIGAADLATAGTATVQVVTPPPGGGTSNVLTLPIAAPIVLTINPSSPVTPGTTVTVTLANGLGGSLDWLALALTSAPTTSYVAYTYIGNGVTNRTWTVTMPSTPGTYEVRYFPNNSYTTAATSPPITVAAGPAPAPVVTSLSPSVAMAGTAAFTLTVNGSSFTNASVVRWNGSNRTTTFQSANVLQAAITAADIAAVGTAQVSVFTPAPGGGTSGSVTFTIAVAPTLTVSASTAAPGSAVTVTLSGGLGGATDWITFAATSAPNTSYLAYTYVGSGVTSRQWTVTMPSTPGQYEFRLFPNNGYTRAATSPPVTVTAPPVPVASSLAPASVVAGSAAFTLTVNGSGFSSASVVNWNGASRATTFVSGTQLQAAVSAADVAAVGTAQVSVTTPAPGGGTSGSLPFAIVPPPTLSVSTTSTATGAPVTVTLSGGFGGATDWIALAPTSAANTSYVAYTYVGSGVTSRPWTVNMPTTAGTYEFRLFPNNGYTRAATSAPITVIAPPPPAPVTSSLSPSIVVAGAGGFTLTVNGSGFAATSVVNWNGAPRATTFVSGTQLRATIADADVAAVGTAQVSVFTPAPGGGASDPLTVTIVPAPVLTVSTTTAAPGSTVTVTLTGGLGGASDWIALAPTSAANTSYVAYTYIGNGVTTRTMTFTMPSTPGTYEFRLFPNNGYTRAATSATIVVQ